MISTKKELHCEIYNSDDLHLHYAKGPSIEPGREFHIYNEILYIPKITGKLITESGKIDIKSGTLLVIPRESFHHLIVDKPNEYTRFCFNFDNPKGLEEIVDICMRNTCIIENPSERIVSLFNSLPAIFSESEIDKGILIFAVFSEILVYLKKELKRGIQIDPKNSDEVICNVLNYINKNYCSPINLDEISDNLKISPSSLSHIFKKNLNISVYKYITDKRMITAQKLIKSGVSPTVTAFKCGFTDYTAFYRSYKKYYGMSPKESKNQQIFLDPNHYGD